MLGDSFHFNPTKGDLPRTTYSGPDHDGGNAVPLDPGLFDGALNGESDSFGNIGCGGSLECASNASMGLLGLMRMENHCVRVCSASDSVSVYVFIDMFTGGASQLTNVYTHPIHSFRCN
jgi:hypothetical protein